MKKGEEFREGVEAWHGITVSDPAVSTDYFSIALKVDLTFKGQEKTSMNEIILYEVRNGKIVKELFYY